MARQSIALADIRDFDLNLAKNDRALAAAAEIRALSLEDRQQRLHDIRQKIESGAANLFEERVLSVLLEPQGAERILSIQQHLPRIEKAREQQRPGSQRVAAPATFAEPPAATAAPTSDQSQAAGVQPQKVESQAYQSELLDFIASQKPPTPPSNSTSAKPARSLRVETESLKVPGWSRRDQAIGVGLVMLLGLAIGSSILSQRAAHTPVLTFDQQARQQAASSDQPALPAEAQAEFDAAMQGLRTGDFAQARTQLVTLMTQYPQAPQTEAGYMALADTLRQRQSDPDQALTYYQRLLEEFPHSLNVGLAQLKMGFAYEDLEDRSNAKAMYQLVLDQHGSQSRMGQLAGQRLSALDRE